MESVIFTLSGLRPSLSLILTVLLALVASGCAPVDDSSSADGAQVKIFRIPWPNGSGKATLQDISLSTFRDHESLRGDVATILVDPRIEAGSVVSDEPVGRFTRVDERFIPSDFVTLQATTIYAHLERLNQIDQRYKLDSFFSGPARIGLQARISAGPSMPLIYDNAIYDGRLDSLFFVPFSGDQLPISLNAGIVAHEHYHRTFQFVILNAIREAARTGSIPYGWDDSIACSQHHHNHAKVGVSFIELAPITSDLLVSNQIVPLKIYNQVLLRALNEGLADFWGWAYARDDEFVGRSLGEGESKVRRLDKPAFVFPQKVFLRNSLVTVSRSGLPVLKSEQGRVAEAYRFGTEYARTLRGLVDRLSRDAGLSQDDAVERVRAALARSMPELSQEILKQWGRTEIEPEALLKPMLTALLQGPTILESTKGSVLVEASISKAVCDELSRLRASSDLTSGLCQTPMPPAPAAEPLQAPESR